MGLDELKFKLTECIRQCSISNFDAEDIIELVSEGEDIDWIVGQLKGDTPIDVDAVAALLLEIRGQLSPEKDLVQNETAELAVESGAPEISPTDQSSSDLSQISEMLPEGMELPPGFDTNQIKSLLESPQGKIMADFLVFCQERGVDLTSGKLNDPRTERLQNEWLSTPRNAFDGKKPSEMLSQVQDKVETFRRQSPQVGRNDPCPCGSGKKFKKCCGRT